MANPPIVSTLTRIERLPLATLTVLCSRMPQGALQIIPAFDPYVRGLIVLQTENQRWAVPVGPGQRFGAGVGSSPQRISGHGGRINGRRWLRNGTKS